MYIPLHQSFLHLNLTSSIVSPLTYSICFFQVSLLVFLVLFFPLMFFITYFYAFNSDFVSYLWWDFNSGNPVWAELWRCLYMAVLPLLQLGHQRNLHPWTDFFKRMNLLLQILRRLGLPCLRTKLLSSTTSCH